MIDRELIRESKANEWGPILKQGDDGVYFLNYLRGCVELEPEFDFVVTLGLGATSLLKHRETIEKGIKTLQSQGRMNERILQKYFWLIKYHNSVVDEVGEHKEDLRIPEGILG